MAPHGGRRGADYRSVAAGIADAALHAGTAAAQSSDDVVKIGMLRDQSDLYADSTGRAVVGTGDKSWFSITADYDFGQALENV